MASITPRGNSWRAEIRRKGHRPVVKTFGTKAQAEAWAIQKEAEMLGHGTATDGSHTLLDALKRYKRDVSPSKKGARWEEVRIDKLIREIKFVGKRLDEVSPDDIGIWRDQRLKEVSAGSVLRELTLLSGVFSVARKEWRWCRANPVRDAGKPKKPRHRRRRISDGEIKALLDAANYDPSRPPSTLTQEVMVMMLLAIETGMRSSELLRLRWPTVYLAKRFAHLPDSKNDDSRDVPLSTEAVRLLKLMQGLHAPEVFAVDSHSRDALFRALRDSTNIKNLKFHDSRHEAISRLAQKLHVLDLAKMVGVRNPKTLMIYYDRDASEVASLLG